MPRVVDRGRARGLDAEVLVALRGTALAPPDITVSPGAISEQMVSGERRTTTMVIGNDGATDLNWSIFFDGLQPGVVVIESIWPNRDFDEGLGVNALVSAEPGKPNGGAIYHDTAVWIKPVDGEST